MNDTMISVETAVHVIPEVVAHVAEVRVAVARVVETNL